MSSSQRPAAAVGTPAATAFGTPREFGRATPSVPVIRARATAAARAAVAIAGLVAAASIGGCVTAYSHIPAPGGVRSIDQPAQAAGDAPQASRALPTGDAAPLTRAAPADR